MALLVLFGFAAGAATALSPCVLPVLPIALSAGATGAIGSAVVLYFLMLGGRRAIAPLARRGGSFQIAMGAVMVLVALAMLGNYDIRFQNAIASDLPSFLVNPSEALEDSASAQDALVDLRGGGHGVGSEATERAPGRGSDGRLDLPVLGKAPEFPRHRALVQHPGKSAADAAGPAGPRRPRGWAMNLAGEKMDYLLVSRVAVLVLGLGERRLEE